MTKYPERVSWGARDVNEVPTVLAYKKGQKEPVAWGWAALRLYKAKKSEYLFAFRFKLLLSERENTKHLRNDLRTTLLVDGRTEVDLIADFLKPMRIFALEHIQRSQESEAAFSKWTTRWTLTVPADWFPPARRKCLKLPIPLALAQSSLSQNQRRLLSVF